MDIRQAFKRQQTESNKKKAKKQSTSGGPVIIEDEDDFKICKTKRTKNKKNKIKYDFDSDDEEVIPPEKKAKLSSSSSSSKVKDVSVDSFFGSKPIKRSNKGASSKADTTKMANKKIGSELVSESPFGSPISKTVKPSTLKESHDILNKRPLLNSGGPPPPAKKLKLLIERSKSAEQILKSVSPSPRKQSPSKIMSPAKQSTHKSPSREKSKSKTPEPKAKVDKDGIASNTKQISPAVHRSSQKIKDEKKKSEPIASPTGPPKLSHSSSYQAYLNREGPKAPGSKEIPDGASNCLTGLTFVFTGVGESMDREESSELAKKYGARVTTNVSGKTTYLVCGEGAGESKIDKAKSNKVKIIDEDQFLEMIRTRPPGKHASTPSSTPSKRKKKRPASAGSKSIELSTSTDPQIKTEPQSQVEVGTQSQVEVGTHSQIKVESDVKIEANTWNESSSAPSSKISLKAGDSCNNLMLVDKYSPVSTSQIIGQKGEKSNVKKLAKWLREWFDYHGVAATKKPVHSSGKSSDGSWFKAALLSGPPGIGKTTSATLVCKEEGFTYTELNASACRAKKALQSEVAATMGSLSIDAFVKGGGGVEAGKRHVLIMDEVDGMAGNEDRGGVQELIKLIKTSSIPVICICNDRQHIKIRSLANYCYDLRFQKPKLEQIKGSMMSIAFKEGIKLNPQALQEIIITSNNDIRQVLHNLSLWAAMDKTVTLNEAMKSAKKEKKMSPFDVVKSVFLPMDGDRELSLNEKASLFFQDYSFGPLFVQENYLRIKAAKARNTKELLLAMSNASDAIAKGDLVSKIVRSEQTWGLLPIQAMYSSVLPGEYMRGTMGQPPHFPQWLGNNSKQNKCSRILQELQQHTRLVCSCDRTELGMEYLPMLYDRLTRPLLEQGSEGVPEVISQLESYDMTKDDWESVIELSQYSGRDDVMSKLSTQTKAAFTRTYNKSNHALPYSVGVEVKKKSNRHKSTDDDDDELYDGSDGESGIDSDSSESNSKHKLVAEKYLRKPKKQTDSKTKTKTKKKS